MNTNDLAAEDPRLKRPSEALKSDINVAETEAILVSDKGVSDAKMLHAFSVGSIGVLLPEDTVSELVEDLPVCQIPNTNSIFYGVGSLRGSIVPIFDLQQLFGMGKTDHTYYIVIGVGEKSVAVLIDKMPKQIEIGSHNRFKNMPPLPGALKSFSVSAYREDGLWVDCRLIDLFRSLTPLIAH